MDCKNSILAKIKTAAIRFEFPAWENGEVNRLTGAMAVSGMVTEDDRYLNFESIEHSLPDGEIKNIATLFGTDETNEWLIEGNGVSLFLQDEDGNFAIKFGDLTINIRDRSLTINLDKDQLIEDGYLPVTAEVLTEAALLFKLADAIPKDLLYSSVDYLKNMFNLPESAYCLFRIDAWHHPTLNELYGEGILEPNAYPDLIEIADAVCSNREPFQLSGKPNTNWRQHG